MQIDTNSLHTLSTAEKMQLVEMLWDDLGATSEAIPLPDWVKQEIKQRRQDMNDPAFGLSHDEVWQRINNRNG